MATSKKSTSAARTVAKKAGKPVQPSTSRAAAKRSADASPTPADLDLRDRLKSGPRRPAGPPLAGDTPTRSAMDALRAEVLPEPTDPKRRRGGN